MTVVPTYCIGFYACLCIRLFTIITYYNTYSTLPIEIDSSGQLTIYKPEDRDIIFDFFCRYDNTAIICDKKVDYFESYQYSNYKTLDYTNICKFVAKYFAPTKSIVDIRDILLRKYSIDVDNTLAIYYRGTDKKRETVLGTFETYYEKIDAIRAKNVGLKLLIQTDTQQFKEYMNTKYDDILYIDENRVSSSDRGIHNETTPSQNYIDAKYLLSTVLILSRCKYIICSSGNVSIWIMLYRGNAKNVYQYYNDRWF